MAEVTAIIQARLGSSRLPGKTLIEIKGKPLLGHVIDRVSAARLINRVIVATANTKEDEAVFRFAVSYGAFGFIGAEEDVLDRYYQAAKEYAASNIVRITADNPFLDPELIDRVVGCYLENRARVDYASNKIKPTYPDGLDVETFSFEALETAWFEAEKASEREHVTPYIYNHPEKFRLASVENDKDFSHLRWTLDYEEDLRFAREIYMRLYGDGRVFGMREILRLLENEPELSIINRGIIRNEGYIKSLEKD